MSSLTVLCPNGHRVKVSTNPNMSLQAVLDFAANKKGFDPATHVLEFHKKRIDLSSSVRFSGIDDYFNEKKKFIDASHRPTQQCNCGDGAIV